MNVLYYDCFSGICGDMHLGAMIDLGVAKDYLINELSRLDLTGYEIKVKDDIRKGISGTKVDVIIDEGNNAHHSHRNLKDIEEIVVGSSLSEKVKQRSMKMFRVIAEAEAKVHQKSIDEIHFHEVGAVDSIIDIVGAAICIEHVNPDRIVASNIELGGGFVNCAHGKLPVPAPATVEILKGIPVRSGSIPFETTTPTGAAILKANVDEFIKVKDFCIEKIAYGIGNRDTDIPNVLRLYSGEFEEEKEQGDMKKRDTATMIECNIDDMNPELYGYVMNLLFEKGADDVFITPIIMKKARPASKISVLCSHGKENEMIDALLLHTIKSAIYKGKIIKSKPEYEDCLKIARENNITFQELYNEALKNMNEKTKE